MARSDWKIGGWIADDVGVKHEKDGSFSGMSAINDLFNDAVRLAEALEAVLSRQHPDDIKRARGVLASMRYRKFDTAAEDRIVSIASWDTDGAWRAVNQLLRDVAEIRERLPSIHEGETRCR